MRRELRDLLDNARARGWVAPVATTGRLRHPTGATVYTASTPSCSRAVANAAAMLRRVERRHLPPTAGRAPAN